MNNNTKLNTLFPMRTVSFKVPQLVPRWPDLFGVELEVENPTTIEAPAQWVAKQDMSLRDGIEFITKVPVGGAGLERALASFYAAGIGFRTSARCSTHIHVNMTDTTVGHLRAMVVLMYTVEDMLYNVIGEGRKWAGYSMPLSEMTQQRLRTILTADTGRAWNAAVSPAANQERYYGFNVSLKRHGTVEFRHFPGGPSRQELEQWLDFVYCVKKGAAEWPIERLLDVDNMHELERVIRSVFTPEWAEKLLADNTLPALWERFTEVTTAAMPSEVVERTDPLVFLSPALLKYVQKKLCRTDEQRAEAAAMFRKFTVVSAGEFRMRIGAMLGAGRGGWDPDADMARLRPAAHIYGG